MDAVLQQPKALHGRSATQIFCAAREELDMLQQTDVQPIQKAVMIIHEMSDDEKIQELARLREKALCDENF